MALSTTQFRIAAAIVGGLVLVALAYWLQPEPDSAATPQAAVTVDQQPKRNYIDIVDTDGNGVPDWQEALQTTEALAVGSSSASSTFVSDGTLTEQLALEFFQGYVQSEQYGDFSLSPEELVNETSAALADKAVDEPITRSQIVISDDTSTSALQQYGERVAEIVDSNSTDSTEVETEILDRAIRTQNQDELKKLDPIISAYEAIVEETMALPVPRTLVKEHLVLVNAYTAILSDIYAMRDSFVDPMMSLLRLQRYQDDATALYYATFNLYTQLETGGVAWTEDSIIYRTFGYLSE